MNVFWSFVSFQTARKKLFLLYDLEPSHNITGGTFYSGDEFESEFVDVLADQCYKYLVQAVCIITFLWIIIKSLAVLKLNFYKKCY